MKIAEKYSHLNGLEFLLVHKPSLWREIEAVIAAVDASECQTKVSKEKKMKGKLLFSPIDMNAAFNRLLRKESWDESRVNYWVTKSEKLIRKTLTMSAEEQKREIEAAGGHQSIATTRLISLRIALPWKFSLANTRSLLTISSSSTWPSMWVIVLTSESKFSQ